jgi:hypothetical protein
MIILKKWQLVALFIANVITLNACSNSNANNNQVSVNSASQQKTEKAQQAAAKGASKVQAELDNAKKAGKAVFMVVTGTGATDTEKATAIAKDANGIYKNAVIVQMNRDDAANAPLVAEWRLSGAPVPLILVFSSKGQLTGGYVLAEATAENIVELVPTPKLDEVYESLNNGKPVFLVISKKSHTDRAKILENCKSAASQLQNKASIIEVDLTDTKEAIFIKNLSLKNTPNTSTILVLNASGQATGKFEGTAETDQLVLAANKVVRSSCGSSCAPGACGPAK